MTGTDIFKDSQPYADIHDLIEQEAATRLDEFGEKEETEITEEDADRIAMIMDYKFRAQEALENSYLVMKRLADV